MLFTIIKYRITNLTVGDDFDLKDAGFVCRCLSGNIKLFKQVNMLNETRNNPGVFLKCQFQLHPDKWMLMRCGIMLEGD
jgi:hypothetical protein